MFFILFVWNDLYVYADVCGEKERVARFWYVDDLTLLVGRFSKLEDRYKTVELILNAEVASLGTKRIMERCLPFWCNDR